jgi:hypothetical protein
MKITNHHNKRIHAIIKQFSWIDKDLIVSGIYGNKTTTLTFNPSKFSFDRLRIIFKFISEFPDDEDGNKISFINITSSELCDCELRFSSWLNTQEMSLPIFNEEWDRIINSY